MAFGKRRGLSTFVEVGKALPTIRDAKLYRKGHKTFEAYCRERWGMSRLRADELIDAAGVVDNLSTTVDSERIIRPLTRLPKSEQERARSEAAGLGSPSTWGGLTRDARIW